MFARKAFGNVTRRVALGPRLCASSRILDSTLMQQRTFGCHAQRQVDTEAGFYEVAEVTLEQIQDAVDALDDHMDDVEVEYSVHFFLFAYFDFA